MAKKRNKKKSKMVGISKLTGEVFIGGICKLKIFRKNRWRESQEIVLFIKAAQARMIIAEDTPENYPPEEGW